MTEPKPLPGALLSADLISATNNGYAESVQSLLEAGADPNATDENGIRALYFACSGGHPELATLLRAPFELPLTRILRGAPTPKSYAAIAAALLARGAHPNERFGPAALTPLMVAQYFRCDSAARVLLEYGANPELRDAFGRSADRLRIFGTLSLLVQRCETLPMVKAAYLANLHIPATEQYTTPLVGLELAAPLPNDAFADWPAADPMVVFALSGDAVSRLIKLSAPVYAGGTFSTGREVGAAIAQALGGKVHVLPKDGESSPIAVSLASGQVPILIRDYRRHFSISVQGAGSFHPKPGSEAQAAVAQVVACAEAWHKEHPNSIAMLDAALDLIRTLSAEFNERWSVSIPSPTDPTEMWLSGESGGDSSVGLFKGRAVVWLGGNANTVQFRNRSELEKARSHIIAHLRTQKNQYALNLKTSARLSALATELKGKLEQRLTIPDSSGWQLNIRGSTTYEGTLSASIRYEQGGKAWDAVEITSEGSTISAHAGLFGDLGFRGELTNVDAALDGIVNAIQTSLVTLTIDRLERGKRYQVLETLQGLKQGDVVEYVGYNDIDNHYGEYDFRNQDGKDVTVGGDCSSHEGDPLRETYRHLKELAGPGAA